MEITEMATLFSYSLFKASEKFPSVSVFDGNRQCYMNSILGPRSCENGPPLIDLHLWSNILLLDRAFRAYLITISTRKIIPIYWSQPLIGYSLVNVLMKNQDLPEDTCMLHLVVQYSCLEFSSKILKSEESIVWPLLSELENPKHRIYFDTLPKLAC